MLCLALMNARMSESVWLSPVRGMDDRGLSCTRTLEPLGSWLCWLGQGEGRILLAFLSLKKKSHRKFEEKHRANSGFGELSVFSPNPYGKALIPRVMTCRGTPW